MTFELDLVRCGEYVQSARLASGGKLDNNVSLALSTGTSGSVSPGGSTNSAYPLSMDVTFVNAATSSTAGNAAVLPSNKGAGYMTVFNNTAFSIYVFAPFNGTINNYAVAGIQTNNNNGYSGSFQIGANKSATMMSSDGMAWLAQHAG